MANAADRPIFIVGCQRSGTTLLRLILDAHPNLSCGPETRFLEDLARITGDGNWPRMRLFGFPKEYWHERIAALFDEFQGDYARARGKARWADKTPRYALCIDYLDRLFPTCQVVHVIRDGRDVVASHRHRWGYLSALKAVKKWPWYVHAARAAGARLAAQGRYHEVRYEELVSDPEAALTAFLESSYAARKELATELGCPASKMGDSAQMNMWLHKTVLQKLADNGGNVPKELLD